MTGYYMYIECTPPHPGDIARLSSPTFVPDASTTSTCWSFYYHMYGGHMGTLKVLVIPFEMFQLKKNMFGDFIRGVRNLSREGLLKQ